MQLLSHLERLKRVTETEKREQKEREEERRTTSRGMMVVSSQGANETVHCNVERVVSMPRIR